MNEVARELPRRVFDRLPGSKIYWIRYADANGRERREKFGSRISSAVTLYQRRKTEAFESRKLLEPRRHGLRFSDLAIADQEAMIQKLQTPEPKSVAIWFERNGCYKCRSHNLPHAGNALCMNCRRRFCDEIDLIEKEIESGARG